MAFLQSHPATLLCPGPQVHPDKGLLFQTLQYGEQFCVFPLWEDGISPYHGFVSIPLGAGILMVFIALVWFIIALNSSIATVHIESRIFSILKDTLIGIRTEPLSLLKNRVFNLT